MNLKDFNSRYKYQSDIEKYGFSDVWEIIKPNAEGIYKGDCESYARTLKNLIPEFKDWEYYYCKLSGNGHCILHNNCDVIDCNVKRVVSLEQYNRMFTITELKKYHWFVISSKISFAKVYTWVN